MTFDIRSTAFKESFWRSCEAKGMSREEFEEKFEWIVDHFEETDAMFTRDELTEDDPDISDQ